MAKRDQHTKTTITIPQVKLPQGASNTRNPPGWGSLKVRIKGQGSPLAGRMKIEEPAGEPPPTWPGTRPEWAVQWGLEHNGLVDGLDFTYQARLPGVGAGYYSTIDFLLPDFGIGIEVQGKYWHYGQGSAKIFTDLFRVSAFAGQGIHVIFIDEGDALADPQYYVKEALQGNDHSHVINTGKAQ
jgi:hypothetical protein